MSLLKATNTELLESYKKLGNIWKVAEEFNMCGQTVWERLKKLNAINTKRKKKTNIIVNGYESKICIQCNNLLPLIFFYSKCDTYDKKTIKCKECIKRNRNEYRNKNKGLTDYQYNKSFKKNRDKYLSKNRDDFKQLQIKTDNLFGVWMGIKSRCYVKNAKSYKYYGAKGIRVHDKWYKSFQNFYDWCKDNGFKKGFHLHRIKNNGNYVPANCEFLSLYDHKKKHKLQEVTT